MGNITISTEKGGKADTLVVKFQTMSHCCMKNYDNILFNCGEIRKGPITVLVLAERSVLRWSKNFILGTNFVNPFQSFTDPPCQEKRTYFPTRQN